MRHVIEPEISYLYIAGIDNFSSILRFDPVDIATNTSELQYALTQRLYFKRLKPKPCTNPDVPPPVSGRIYLPLSYRECGGDTSESITWTIAQKYFFQPGFGDGQSGAGLQRSTLGAADGTAAGVLTWAIRPPRDLADHHGARARLYRRRR